MDKAGLTKCLQSLSDQPEIHIELTVEEGFEDKVTARQLGSAIGEILAASSLIGADTAAKLRVYVILPGSPKDGVQGNGPWVTTFFVRADKLGQAR